MTKGRFSFSVMQSFTCNNLECFCSGHMIFFCDVSKAMELLIARQMCMFARFGLASNQKSSSVWYTCGSGSYVNCYPWDIFFIC
jgi:hypothetical protein